MTKTDPTLDPEVTRFEVIDESGRVYTRRNVEVRTSRQDGGRTLKLFVTERAASMVQHEDLGDV